MQLTVLYGITKSKYIMSNILITVGYVNKHIDFLKMTNLSIMI